MIWFKKLGIILCSFGLFSNPSFAQAFYNRGRSQYFLNNYFAAIKDFQNAIKIDPNLSMAHYNLGVIEAKQNNKKDACRYWEKGQTLEMQNQKEQSIYFVKRG